MRYDNWIVSKTDERPGRPDGTCFYCSVPIGGEHKPNCVIRRRSVVVRFSVEAVVDMPESWTPQMIEEHYNEGRWCGDNIISIIGSKRKNRCLCSDTTAKFVREASEEDEAEWGFDIDQE